MDPNARRQDFETLVTNRFNVYNSLFLSLPFRQIRQVGVLIPLLGDFCEEQLTKGGQPIDILDGFFAQHTDIETEADRIDFMFRVVQYVERQIVLFDSVEDAAFPELLEDDEQLSLIQLLQFGRERSVLGTGDREAVRQVTQAIADFSARVVFTAHPTQFYPPSVLLIIAKLREAITANDITEVDRLLRQLGLTSLLSEEAPTPLDEAHNILLFLRHVYYDAVGELYADVKSRLPEGSPDAHGLLKLGFWPGGDRDGNPFVTSETTRQVARDLRMTLMKCYYNDVKLLDQRLTFRGLHADVRGLRERLYAAMFDEDEPLSYAELESTLVGIREQLVTRYSSLYLTELDDFIDKTRIFRTHFASIDVRQNHRVHRRLIEAVLVQNGHVTLSIDELTKEQLTEILLSPSMSIDESCFEDDLLRDTVETMRAIRDIQALNGEEGCHRYIISHAEDEFAVLFVFALLRWVWSEEAVSVDIIPLFESMTGMSNAPDIMDALFNMTPYREHVQKRVRRQTMMLGFSDGTKDGGYLEANWTIQTTKEALTATCRAHDVEAVFFDGRGGPPARGGGKTHRFYASQGPGVASHALELTIQGQMISSTYGTKAHFRHNCELLIAAGLHQHLFGHTDAMTADQRSLMEELSDYGYESYTALKNDPRFVPYLEKRSTLRFYTRANIGSRPASRSSSERLSLDDLRAIPFVGSWSQLKQNVPGYYGIGTALKKVADDGRMEDLKALFSESPFFHSLALNSMMSLSKCRFELTAYMADDPEFGEFWQMLKAEYELSVRMLLSISGSDELMKEEPISRASVAIRERLVIPLLMIQQYALMKIEEGSGPQETWEKLVTRSLYGNINASRNSA